MECQMNEENNPWQINGKKEIYDNPWINVTEYDVLNPNGGKGIYGKVHFKNIAIGILPLDEDDNTWLVGQYRFVLNQYSWEIPEGGCPFGEEPLAAAKRELLEETGLEAAHWQELLQMYLSNSVSDELAIVYVATQLTQQTASPEETEQLAVKKMPFSKVAQMVDDGSIKDALTVAAVQKLQLMKLQAVNIK